MRGEGTAGSIFILFIFSTFLIAFMLMLVFHATSNYHTENSSNIANTTNNNTCTSTNPGNEEETKIAYIIILALSMILAFIIGMSLKDV